MAYPNSNQASPLFWMTVPSSIQKSMVSFQQTSLPVDQPTSLGQDAQQSSLTMQQSAITVQQQSAVALPQQPLVTFGQQPAVTLPQLSAVTLPQQSAVTLPQQSSVTLPQQSALTIPQQSVVTLPQQTDATLSQQLPVSLPQLPTLSVAQESLAAQQHQPTVALQQQCISVQRQQSSVTFPQQPIAVEQHQSAAALQQQSVAIQQHQSTASFPQQSIAVQSPQPAPSLQQHSIAVQQQQQSVATQQQPIMTIPFQQPVYMQQPQSVSTEKSVSIHTMQHSAVTVQRLDVQSSQLTLPQVLPLQESTGTDQNSLVQNQNSSLVSGNVSKSVQESHSSQQLHSAMSISEYSNQSVSTIQGSPKQIATETSKTVRHFSSNIQNSTSSGRTAAKTSSSSGVYILPAPPKPTTPTSPQSSQQLMLPNRPPFAANNLILSVPTTLQSSVQPQQLIISPQSLPQQVVLPLQSSNPIILQSINLNGSQSIILPPQTQLPTSQPSQPASQSPLLLQSSGSLGSQKTELSRRGRRRPRVIGAFKRPNKMRTPECILEEEPEIKKRSLRLIKPMPTKNSDPSEQPTEIKSPLKDDMTTRLEHILHHIDEADPLHIDANSLSVVKSEADTGNTIRMQQAGDKLNCKVSLNLTSMLQNKEVKMTTATQTGDTDVIDLTEDEVQQVKQEIINDSWCDPTANDGAVDSLPWRMLQKLSSDIKDISQMQVNKGTTKDNKETTKAPTRTYRKIAPKLTIHNAVSSEEPGKNALQANITNNITVDVNISTKDLNKACSPIQTAPQSLYQPAPTPDLTKSTVEERTSPNVVSFPEKDVFLQDLANLGMNHVNNVVVKRNLNFSTEKYCTRSPDPSVKLEPTQVDMGFPLKPPVCSTLKSNDGSYALMQPSESIKVEAQDSPEPLTSELESFMKLCEEASSSVFGDIGLQMENIKTEAPSP